MKQKKTVIITGASRGIGATCAYMFALHDYNVVINYNNSQEAAENLLDKITKIGKIAICVKADVSKYHEAEKLIKIALEKFSSVDILINNAGISEYSLFTDSTTSHYDNIFDTNVRGTYNATHVVLPHMIKNKSGNIINVSSIWGQVGASCEVLYSATKAALIGFTKALSKEVGLSNIRVNAIAPGVIQTDMLQEFTNDELSDLAERTSLGTLGQTEDIANLALFLASNESKYITGQVLTVDGGLL